MRLFTILLLLAQVNVMGVGYRHVYTTVPGCVAPTMTARWTAWNPANTCSGGCSTGNTLSTEADMVGTNTLSNTSFSLQYAANMVNGLAAAHFTTSSSSTSFTSASPILTTPSTLSFYAVVEPADSSAAYAIFGGIQPSGAPEWGIAPTSGFPTLIKAFVSTIGTGNVAVSTTAFSTIAVTYTVSTGAVNFYTCSGGTCTSAGTATNSVAFGTGSTNEVGNSVGENSFKGYIAEEAASTGILNLSTLGAYSQCEYGI